MLVVRTLPSKQLVLLYVGHGSTERVELTMRSSGPSGPGAGTSLLAHCGLSWPYSTLVSVENSPATLPMKPDPRIMERGDGWRP